MENSAGYLLPQLRPGISILGVGCGPGTITVDLAARVAPVTVTAVDVTEEILELARAEAGRRLLSWAQEAGFDDIAPTGGIWCFATREDRDRWGGMWADRILQSALTRQLVDSGMATMAELTEIASAWRAWAATPDGWLAIPHGEILCRA